MHLWVMMHHTCPSLSMTSFAWLFETVSILTRISASSDLQTFVSETRAKEGRICVHHLPMTYSLSRSMSNLGPSWPVFLRTTICSDGAFTSSDGAFSDGAFTSSDGAFSDGAVGKVVSESAAARVGTAKGKSARRSQREQHVRDAVHLPD